MVAAHLPARYRGIGVTDVGEQEFQVFVNLRNRTHRRTRVMRHGALLDGDSRRDALDGLHFRFVHTAQKLPGIGAQALHIAALALRI